MQAKFSKIDEKIISLLFLAKPLSGNGLLCNRSNAFKTNKKNLVVLWIESLLLET